MKFHVAIQNSLGTIEEDENWAISAADAILADAWRRGASDLHILARSNEISIQIRCEGVLCEPALLGEKHREILVHRFKVLSDLQPYVSMKPQDGRVTWQPPGAEELLTLRTVFMPIAGGEKITVRFPPADDRFGQIENLGFSDKQLECVREMMVKTEGVIFLTGPSGCGKTSTAFAMLRYLQRKRGQLLNFMTIEDPVERRLPFAAQVQTNEAQDLTYTSAFRSALRCDPDVIFLGEVRDVATANLAVSAGLSGHLIISTIHAGRAPQVYTRLLSMGIEPYLVAAAVRGVVAQRLVPSLCENCREEGNGDGEWIAPGCEDCNGSGHGERQAIFEVVSTSNKLRRDIIEHANIQELERSVARSCQGTFKSRGEELVADGRISRAELALLLGPQQAQWDMEEEKSQELVRQLD